MNTYTHKTHINNFKTVRREAKHATRSAELRIAICEKSEKPKLFSK